MIKKIVFAGCSTTAGNELWEEKNVPGYSSMSFDDARSVKPDGNDWRDYNYQNSFPAIIGQKLGIDTVNLGWPGLSNKEIVGRLITQFPESKYQDTLAFIQLTTHNRFLLRFQEGKEIDTFGSFVAGLGSDKRLSRSQQNLLTEMFFEFFPETLLSIDDFVYIDWAINTLKEKGVQCYVITVDSHVTEWGNWNKKSWITDKPVVPAKNDRDPQYIEQLGLSLWERYIKNNLLSDTIVGIAGHENILPRYHINHHAHRVLAETIIEELKNVKLV